MFWFCFEESSGAEGFFRNWTGLSCWSGSSKAWNVFYLYKEELWWLETKRSLRTESCCCLLFTVAGFRSFNYVRKGAIKLGAIDFTSPLALIKVLPSVPHTKATHFCTPTWKVQYDTNSCELVFKEDFSACRKNSEFFTKADVIPLKPPSRFWLDTNRSVPANFCSVLPLVIRNLYS